MFFWLFSLIPMVTKMLFIHLLPLLLPLFIILLPLLLPLFYQDLVTPVTPIFENLLRESFRKISITIVIEIENSQKTNITLHTNKKGVTGVTKRYFSSTHGSNLKRGNKGVTKG